jgi:hypothetical protein
VAGPSKNRARIKFVFWTVLSVIFVGIAVRSHLTGQMASWYYHTAGLDGYAVNAKAFMHATATSPAFLDIGTFTQLDGLQAVRVKKGDRLPANANGIISQDVLKAGKRASVVGNRIAVTIPWQMQEAKGFKYKDSFMHKGIHTNPWAALWNVVMVIAIGLSLGFMAEGLTDAFGVKFEKISHFQGH